ncbi:phage major capsid protein [Geomicrobium sediminis]|uniref:HK97 family phage major capsid protein n=1 Tax=Geomicrobium sediminis TaxID=1347788 RepID=A0ABS2P716_9BACL|nr:phage major capsid protein [Geomicrobium sediminis]MBM7631107.1 HK97 family phage major capsid protein [Geomicrobium sediminis]
MTYLKDELRGFVPKPKANEIMKDVARGSSLIRLSRIEQMTSDKKQFPMMVDGPGAYWVGESERIQTSKAEWIFPEIEAKKLAVIVPTTREKMNDSTIDVFGEMRPAISEAFYTTIDAAGLMGTNSPFSKSVLKSAVEAKNEITLGDNLDIDASELMGLIEEKGHDVNGFAAHYGMKNKLRKLRDANGNALFVPGVGQSEFYSNPIEFVRNGAFDKSQAEAIAANWNYSIVGIREDISYEILTEATLQNVTMSDGKPLSLAENDMIAIKATMRIGYLPIKDEAFAVLRPKGFGDSGE